MRLLRFLSDVYGNIIERNDRQKLLHKLGVGNDRVDLYIDKGSVFLYDNCYIKLRADMSVEFDKSLGDYAQLHYLLFNGTELKLTESRPAGLWNDTIQQYADDKWVYTDYAILDMRYTKGVTLRTVIDVTDYKAGHTLEWRPGLVPPHFLYYSDFIRVDTLADRFERFAHKKGSNVEEEKGGDALQFDRTGDKRQDSMLGQHYHKQPEHTHRLGSGWKHVYVLGQEKYSSKSVRAYVESGAGIPRYTSGIAGSAGSSWRSGGLVTSKDDLYPVADRVSGTKTFPDNVSKLLLLCNNKKCTKTLSALESVLL